MVAKLDAVCVEASVVLMGAQKTELARSETRDTMRDCREWSSSVMLTSLGLAGSSRAANSAY